MDLPSNSLSEARSRLFDAVAALNLPICLRRIEEWSSFDTSILYARTDTREVFVKLSENVFWGPALSFYVQEPHEYRDEPILNIEVPNSLDGRIPEIVELVKEWFAEL